MFFLHAAYNRHTIQYDATRLIVDSRAECISLI